MKYLADTHMHSIYSYDGQMDMESMVKRGLELGLKYMAFTEHLEFGQITLKQFLNRYGIYVEQLDRLQEKYPSIQLLKGVEITNPDIYYKELEEIHKLDLDYIIGSNHQLSQIKNEKDIYTYYSTILKMVKMGGFDSLGHMDYIRRKVDDSCFDKDLIKEICSYLIKNDIALEINSSAIRRKNLDSFPSDEKINLYKTCGGEKITIGSDAHRLNEIYDGIEKIDQQYDFDKGIYVKRKYKVLSKR